MASEPDTKVPQCMTCGAPLPKFSKPGHRPRNSLKKAIKDLTGNGKPPEFGTRGDNIVCNLNCAHLLLMRMFSSVPDLANLLAPEWRFDLKPVDDSPKVKKLKTRAKAYAKNQAVRRERQRRYTAMSRPMIAWR